MEFSQLLLNKTFKVNSVSLDDSARTACFTFKSFSQHFFRFFFKVECVKFAAKVVVVVVNAAKKGREPGQEIRKKNT